MEWLIHVCFSDKRVFGIKRQNCGGVSTAGQVCANDVILWVIFLLPINIVIHGAGQCLVAMGLFVGNVVGWIFLSKRMNSYAEISPKRYTMLRSCSQQDMGHGS